MWGEGPHQHQKNYCLLANDQENQNLREGHKKKVDGTSDYF